MLGRLHNEGLEYALKKMNCASPDLELHEIEAFMFDSLREYLDQNCMLDEEGIELGISIGRAQVSGQIDF